jgi:hypothetical protein
MPLMVCVVKTTGFPPIVMLLTVPLGPLLGSIARRFRAPFACAMVNESVLPLHASDLKAEEFRPSSQVSICNAETTGTPCAFAEVTIASAPSD